MYLFDPKVPERSELHLPRREIRFELRGKMNILYHYYYFIYYDFAGFSGSVWR